MKQPPQRLEHVFLLLDFDSQLADSILHFPQAGKVLVLSRRLSREVLEIVRSLAYRS